MINCLLNIKFFLESLTESKPKEQRTLLSKIILNGLKLVDTYIIYWFLRAMRFIGRTKVSPLVDNINAPVVSLTTFPARLNNLWMVLYCMYKQTVLPGKIVVTLIKEEIPGGFDSLPESLKYYADKGVEFLFADENLRPHNKYFYTRQKYPERIVITIDDDLLYYYDTIERLLMLHNKYPEAICSNRVHGIVFNGNKLEKYSKWRPAFKPEGPSNMLCALGYSSVLYPPSFQYIDLFDIDKIKALSLGADDIWLMVMEILSDTKVVVGKYYAHPVTLPSSQKIALQKINNAAISRNDKYISLLDKEYKFVSKLQ